MARCLFCLSEEGPFSSVEHIVPESLGNKELILPAGYVCDKCNNGRLSTLDAVLQDWGPIKFLRVQFGIKNKRGKLPSARFRNVHLEMGRPGHVSVRSLNKRTVTFDPDGFTINVDDGSPFNEKRKKLLTRCLFKITMECLCLDNPSLAYDRRYDDIRKIVLGELDFSGYLGIGTTARPHANCIVQYDFITNPYGNQTTAIAMDLYGIMLVTDLEARKAFNMSGPLARQLIIFLF